MGEHLHDSVVGKGVLDITQKTITIEENIDELGFTKIKHFSSLKEIIR